MVDTILLPHRINLDGFGTGTFRTTNVGGGASLAPPTLNYDGSSIDSEDGDTSYINFVPTNESNFAQATVFLPPGLPEAWFYNPVYDIDVRSFGSLVIDFMTNLYVPHFHSDSTVSFGRSVRQHIALTGSYGVVRITETVDPALAAAAWTWYSTHTQEDIINPLNCVFLELLYDSFPPHTLQNYTGAAQVSARVTYLAFVIVGEIDSLLRIKLIDGSWPRPAVEGIGIFRVKSINGRWYESVTPGSGTVVKVKLDDGLWYDAFWLQEVGVSSTLPGNDIFPGNDVFPGDF